MSTHDLDNMPLYAKRAGLVATILTACITAKFGWSQGEDWVSCIVMGGGLALASFIVGYALVFAFAAFKQRMYAITAACVFVFMVAVCVELLSHIGVAGSARSHDMQQASEKTNTYSDNRAEIERARSELAVIAAGRSPAAISAEMATLETRPWFSQTANCATPGSYTNSCRRYQALKGELAQAQERVRLNAKLEKLTAASASSTAGHSGAASQTAVLASVAAMSTKPTADQQYWTNIGVTLLLGLYFVSIGLLNLIAHAFDHPEAKPTADVIPFAAANDRNTVIVDRIDPTVAEKMQAFQRFMAPLKKAG